jgi:phage host-nuclease inhibitor protein Gam
MSDEFMERLVAGVLERKARLVEIEAEYKGRVAPIKEEIEKLEAALMKLMNEAGVQSVKTKAGTAYFSNVSSVRVVDWPVTLDFIVSNGAWDLLERRVNKTALKELEDGVPGVAIETIRKVNVRRS